MTRKTRTGSLWVLRASTFGSAGFFLYLELRRQNWSGLCCYDDKRWEIMRLSPIESLDTNLTEKKYWECVA